MAYTAIITKEAVRKIDNDDYQISVKVIITDTEMVEVLNKLYSVRYNDSWTIDDVKAKLQRKIKFDWDTFVDEKALFDRAAFGDMVADISTALNTYINL